MDYKVSQNFPVIISLPNMVRYFLVTASNVPCAKKSDVEDVDEEHQADEQNYQLKIWVCG